MTCYNIIIMTAFLHMVILVAGQSDSCDSRCMITSVGNFSADCAAGNLQRYNACRMPTFMTIATTVAARQAIEKSATTPITIPAIKPEDIPLLSSPSRQIFLINATAFFL